MTSDNTVHPHVLECCGEETKKRGAGVSVAVVVHLRLWGGPITGFINEPICRTYLPDILCVVYKHDPQSATDSEFSFPTNLKVHLRVRWEKE